jgi:YbbR domain-containing protein
VTSIEVEPPRVRITGAQGEVLRLSEVLTETIDVGGATADVEKDVAIALSGSHVWLEQVQPVRVRVRVGPVAEPASPAKPGRAPIPPAKGGKPR